MNKELIAGILTALFLLAGLIAILKDRVEFLALPLILGVVWLSIKRLDILLLLIVFLTPLSLNLEDLELGGIGFYFPTEPLLFGVLLLFILKAVRGDFLDSKIYSHPISKFIYIYLGWIFITSLSSELPLVSFKFLLAKLWFIVPAYFIATYLFRRTKNIQLFHSAYLISLCIVVIYTLYNHAQFGFDKESGHWVMTPFYKDHTVYGAALALLFPIALGKSLQSSITFGRRSLFITATVILAFGLIFSYTRAAWVSLVAGAVVYFFLWLRIKLNILLVAFGVIVVFILSFQHEIIQSLERNDSESSSSLTEHVESISNVSSDASNLERLNRWYCAIDMWKERPVVGWGPGVYQFAYAPFQRSAFNTIISTNSADQGNAHSEYLGPLSEQGLPGMILMLVLVYMVSALAFRLYFTVQEKSLRLVVVYTYIGLVTYFTHGIVNNYLDTDKASIPFWGCIAVLVAIDLYHKKSLSDTTAQ
jgi:O-antigen ligase